MIERIVIIISGVEKSNGEKIDNANDEIVGLSVDSDGKYHWCYELNLFTNPTVFITLCKVFGGIVIGCGLFIGLIIQEDFEETIRFILTFCGVGLALMLVLVGISYVIYAFIQGIKYCVVFEMDKKSVKHIQVAKQFKKAQIIAALTTLMGVVSGSPTLMGTGILVGSRNMMETKFKNVSKIKIKRFRNVIYLKAAFEWNQIYVAKENYEEVLAFILEHCPSEARVYGRAIH